MVVGHSLSSPLMFGLSYELYRASGSRSFIYGHTNKVSSRLLLALCLYSGLCYGLPPALNFWVEVSFFCLQGHLWLFSLLPLGLTSLFAFLYSILFYVLSVGGASSTKISCHPSVFAYLAGVVYSLVIVPGSSVFLN